MKITLACILVVLGSKYKTQTLTTANAPVVGDTNRYYGIDTTAYATGLPISVTGSNCVWNFTNLVVNPTVIATAYLSPATVSSSASYSGCTVVEDAGGGFFTFIKSTTTPTTQTEALGFAFATLSLTTNFSNSAIIAKYPMAYGANFSDNLAGTFSTFTINGNCNGTISSKVDGQGILNLPSGVTFNNVIRVKTDETINLTSGFIPLASIKQTVYEFYHSSQKFPVLDINYQSIALTGNSPTVSGFVTGNAKSLIVGIPEKSDPTTNFEIYPNPFQSVLNFNGGGSGLCKQIEIYSVTGQLVAGMDFDVKIDLSFLTRGIYFIRVITEQGIVRRKLIKEE